MGAADGAAGEGPRKGRSDSASTDAEDRKRRASRNSDAGDGMGSSAERRAQTLSKNPSRRFREASFKKSAGRKSVKGDHAVTVVGAASGTFGVDASTLCALVEVRPRPRPPPRPPAPLRAVGPPQHPEAPREGLG